MIALFVLNLHGNAPEFQHSISFNLAMSYSASSDWTSMVTEGQTIAIVDDDEFLSSDDMTPEIEACTLPEELQELIKNFVSTKAVIRVRRKSDCELCIREPCVCHELRASAKQKARQARLRSQQNEARTRALIRSL